MVEDRNETPAELVSVGGDVAPSWLTEMASDDKSLIGTEKYRVLSRVKRIQPMSDNALKQLFGEGSAIVMPDQQLLVKVKQWKGTSEDQDGFRFVPCFFFVEWTTQSDIKDKGTQFILKRSIDPKSDIAQWAQQRDTREELYGDDGKGGQFTLRHVEHLCFVGMVYGDHKFAGHPICLSFERGEHGKGSQFVSAIRMRRMANGEVAPLWSQVWDFRPAYRDREFKWWGLDHWNPPTKEELYITAEEAPGFHALHLQLKKEFEAEKLSVNRDDGEDDVTSAEAKAKAAGITVDPV